MIYFLSLILVGIVLLLFINANSRRRDGEAKRALDAERHDREARENAERLSREAREALEKREKEAREAAERLDREALEALEKREIEAREAAERLNREAQEAAERLDREAGATALVVEISEKNHSEQADEMAQSAALTEELPKPVIAQPTQINETTRLRQRGDHRAAYKASMFLPAIKKGYQIFLQNMGITGLGFRREVAVAFIEDLNQTIRLEREPDNVKDKYAIKVIGIGDSGEYFLGYLPKDVALQIVRTNTFDSIYGRLVRAYRGTDDYLEIQIQIIGLKERKKEFDEFLKKLPLNKSHIEYLTYWGIPFDRNLATDEAEQRIAEHSSKARLDSNAWSEYTTYLNLLEQLDDEDQREYFGIKKVPRKIALFAINALKDELGSYQAVAEDPEMIAERILEEHPELTLTL